VASEEDKTQTRARNDISLATWYGKKEEQVICSKCDDSFRMIHFILALPKIMNVELYPSCAKPFK
jgi:hypothetical protein